MRIHSYAFDPIWYSDSYRSVCAPVSLHFFAPFYPFFRDIPDIPMPFRRVKPRWSGHVEGVKGDRALLEAAERVASNGPIGLVDAMDLWDKAKDGVRLRSFLELFIVPIILDRFGEYDISITPI